MRASSATCLALCLGTACAVRIDFGQTHFACADGETCPAGWQCVDQVCVETPPPADGAVPDGGVDGGVAGSCGEISMVADDFEDGTTTASIWNVDLGGGMTLAEEGGELRITLFSGTGNHYGGYSSANTYDVRGQRASVEIAAAPSPTTGAQMYFGVWGPGDDWVDMRTEAGMLRLAYAQAGADVIVETLPFDPIAERFWGIREEGGTVFFEVSGDGASWEERGQTPLPFELSFMQFYLGAGTYQTETNPGMAAFGSVNGGEPSGTWCPTSSMVDDFEDGVMDRPWGYSYADTGCVLEETDGALVATPSATVVGDCAYYSSSAYTLDTLTVDVSSVTAEGSETFVTLEDLTGRYAQFATSGSELFLRSDSAQIAVPYSPVDDRFWRFRAEGDALTWETSADGVTFTSYATFGALEPGAAVHIALGARTDTPSAMPGQARFEALNVLP